MTPCWCTGQAERCDACKRFDAEQAAARKKQAKNQHGVVLVRKSDGAGGEHVIPMPANRKTRRAIAAKERR